MKLSESTKRNIELKIKGRLEELRQREVKLPDGSLISLAGIGRNMSRPVHRATVLRVVKGQAESRPVKDAVEKFLGMSFWPGGKAA